VVLQAPAVEHGSLGKPLQGRPSSQDDPPKWVVRPRDLTPEHMGILYRNDLAERSALSSSPRSQKEELPVAFAR